MSVRSDPLPAAASSGAPREAVVVVSDVWKAFDEQTALAGVSLTVPRGTIQVIMGPTGCGKSVLLKHVMGLLHPDRGDVAVYGRSMPALPEHELDALRLQMGVVFQSAALFDSLSVAENVAFPLRRHRRMHEPEIARRVAELLAMVEMENTQTLMPSALSGGMRKRVGIARALALAPHLMLYDEPTSGLDPLTARTVDDLILRLCRELRATSIVVTHSVESAFRLANVLAVMDAGGIVASGTPAEILASTHPFVREFLATRTIEVTHR
jgi:phospholipid/cholesterol/gamma-HCH transport system ATP-binding protein